MVELGEFGERAILTFPFKVHVKTHALCLMMDKIEQYYGPDAMPDPHPDRYPLDAEFEGRWTWGGGFVYFRFAEDAVFYKLRFG